MDTLTVQECQAIIDGVTEWGSINVTKKKGGDLQFKQSNVTVWGNQHQNILHEFVLKYDVGDFCTLHIDSPWEKIHPTHIAYAVWITPLNDAYEGGELYFDGQLIPQNIGVPIKYLRTVPHEVKPVTSGTRYSLVSWLFKKEPPNWRFTDK